MAVALANSAAMVSAQGQAGKHSSMNETGVREAPSLAEGPLLSDGCYHLATARLPMFQWITTHSCAGHIS